MQRSSNKNIGNDRVEHNIYKALQRNRIITITSVVALVITVIACLVFSFNIYVHSLNTALVVNGNGEVMPVEWIQKTEIRHTQLKHHLHLFFKYYYELDRDNIEGQRQKALWLINGDDFKKLEQYYTKRGWFDEIKRFGIVQKIDIVSLDIKGQKEPFQFNAVLDINVNRNGIIERYLFQAKGGLIGVTASYPKNPHGLLIVNYVETEWKLQPKEEI